MKEHYESTGKKRQFPFSSWEKHFPGRSTNDIRGLGHVVLNQTDKLRIDLNSIIPKSEWSPEESKKLTAIINAWEGNKDWVKIAAQLGTGKTNKQCCGWWQRNENRKKEQDQTVRKASKVSCVLQTKDTQRSAFSIDPKAVGTWSKAEDELLCDAHSRLGNNWTGIVKELPGKTWSQCYFRYRQLMEEEIACKPVEQEEASKSSQEQAANTSQRSPISDNNGNNSDADETETPSVTIFPAVLLPRPSSSSSTALEKKENDEPGSQSPLVGALDSSEMSVDFDYGNAKKNNSDIHSDGFSSNHLENVDNQITIQLGTAQALDEDSPFD